MKRTPSEEYLKAAKALTEREAEYLLLRMGGNSGRRFDDHKLNSIEALAVQLEIEDEHRNEWHENFAKVRSRYNQL